jgi:GNAT superfamily N-acetyltransferase
LIYEYPLEKRAEILPLFQGVNYLEAVALGTIASDLGKVFVENLDEPKNAIFIYEEMKLVVLGGSAEGDFEELFSKIPKIAGILYSNEKWKLKIKEYFGSKLTYLHRTKMSSSKLDIKKIRELKENIPEGYKIIKINEELSRKFNDRTRKQINLWFGSLERFNQEGFGFCALFNDEIVSVAVSGCYTFDNAFEIDIFTHEDHRRKGLAILVAAYLIEYSLENGFDPRWDAANKPSVALALKLGYTNPEDYEVMFLTGE